MATKSNKTVVPEARAALDKFKMEAANEVGVNLNNSYNGDITARQAGSVGPGPCGKLLWTTLGTMWKSVSYQQIFALFPCGFPAVENSPAAPRSPPAAGK